MDSDPPTKMNSIRTELDEEEAFHNGSHSFSTGDPDHAIDHPTDPSIDLGGDSQQIVNCRDRDDVEKSSERKEIVRSDDTVKKANRRSSKRSNSKKPSPVTTQQRNPIPDSVSKRRVYSREEMVSMRFFGVVQQKRLWREIYNGLGTAAADYANIVDHAKHTTRNVHTNNNAPTIGLLGVSGTGSITSPYNVIVHPYYPTMMKTWYSPYVNYGF